MFKLFWLEVTFREAGYVNASMQKANTVRLRAKRDGNFEKMGGVYYVW